MASPEDIDTMSGPAGLLRAEAARLDGRDFTTTLPEANATMSGPAELLWRAAAVPGDRFCPRAVPGELLRPAKPLPDCAGFCDCIWRGSRMMPPSRGVLGELLQPSKSLLGCVGLCVCTWRGSRIMPPSGGVLRELLQPATPLTGCVGRCVCRGGWSRVVPPLECDTITTCSGSCAGATPTSFPGVAALSSSIDFTKARSLA